MSEEIKKLGKVFKAKREEKNLSLKEVENSTSIRASYLEAIEEGRVERFLSSVYAMGFIRQYALFLGLDIEEITREHPEAFKLPNEKHDFAYGIGTLEVRGSMSGGVKWLPNLIWAGVSAMVIVLAWYLVKYLGIL
jgi:cytoskeletal protein RodZ